MSTPNVSMMALIFITLTLTLLSSPVAADSNGCPGGDTVPEVLKHYGFPVGTQPADGTPMCHEENGKMMLEITRESDCKVTRDLVVFKGVVTYGTKVKGEISEGLFAHVQGVKIMKLSTPISGDILDVTNVTYRVINPWFNGGFLQIDCDQFVRPAEYPVSFFSDPVGCDGLSVVDNNNNHQGTNKWVYEYGGLRLPFVAS